MASRRWYWFPIYFAASVTLGVIAISSAVHSTSKNSPKQLPPITNDHSKNASEALRKAGFTVMADLLHRSPLFFHPPQNSTIFAIKDSAIKNSSLPLWFLKNLLLYHTSTSKTSFHDLLNKPPGTCITTLFRQKKVALTKVDPEPKLVEINHVLISNPDIFLGDQLAVHGVLAPFLPLDLQDLQGGWDHFIHSPTCRFNDSSMFNESRNVVEWNRVVQLLGSRGYASFSIALHSVLDGVRKYTGSLDSATIFAPPDLTLLRYPSTVLDRTVRIHILPQRFTYKELTSLPIRTLLNTLVSEENLEIDGVLGFMAGMVINGVEIVEPDMLVSEKFVVHGISRAFKMDELAA
ncbi:fasciclin-like arabinogalactan protein 21 [Abrus precatorius]|uniref:Fasciclin-like arabinogalactan protein 21 n=1 Tax=Abrus precatorius TaxID=3816 RepID=A0A8B8KHP6_ABRPR|nr:fasciclin-like arabinogalactan protein 21 [Abrus precatorius]